ncbi:hypothetical protein L323_20330 [Ruminiclostridium papyrosolvens C7]|uniref:Uncharacterized protein n=1 Tax=Ruminiclostridium papyrosolvens C7 TaxID=1330534 RepID=U4QWH6_9FIRM|nr:hypothetical protein L323_20330 [Ruminiclostridium papyrosolvens C7]
MTNQKMSQNPRFKVKIPFYNKNFIEIIDTKCKYDIDATNDARSFYLKLKSKKEIAN